MACKDPEEGRARDRERFRKRTAERLAQGLCPNCGKAPPEPERRLCAPCAGKRRQSERVRDAKRRAAGKPRHRNSETERARERRRTSERVAQGLCVSCGKESPAPGRTSCRCCAGKRRAAERARYAKARAAGKLYGGRDPKERRRNACSTAKRRYDARREAGLCTPGAACTRRSRAVRPVSRAAMRGGRANAGSGRRAGRAACAPGAGRPRSTAPRAAAGALRWRPEAIGGRTPPAASATLDGVRGGSAPTADSPRRARRGASRAPASRTSVPITSAACRGLRRATRSSRSRRARTTGRSRAWRRWRGVWRSRGCRPTRLRSSRTSRR